MVETDEITYDTLYENYTDFEEKTLKELIFNRFENNRSELTGKHFYSLKITKTPQRTNYHLFNFESLQEISRKLTNGMVSLGSVPNRRFWNKYFDGGVRMISIHQTNPQEYPSFNINYIVYSDNDNLDVRICPNLYSRIKMIDRSLEFSMEYLGSFDQPVVIKDTDYQVNIFWESEPVKKLGRKNMDDMLSIINQRPRFFGKLFKSNKTQNINQLQK